MKGWKRGIVAASCLAAVALAPAQPLPPPSPEVPRGELLYATHCIGCHSTQVHWREKKLATDWGKLLAQVQRWQANANLGWSEDEIFEVARYLNALFYRLPMPAEKTIGLGAVPERVVPRN